MKRYFYKILSRYIRLYVRPDDVCVEINPKNDNLSTYIKTGKYIVLKGKPEDLAEEIEKIQPDYVVLNGNLHFEKDIQFFLEEFQKSCPAKTRILVCYYSALWRPFTKLASVLGWREAHPEQNWFSPADLHNLAAISNFEVIQHQEKILIPLWLPFISWFFNRFVAPLPFFRLFTLMNISVLKATGKCQLSSDASVSIIVPARNEAGNIREIVRRIPHFTKDIELIFVEGNSTDNTWEEICRIKEEKNYLTVIAAQQDGKGKGDAVRKGFSLATKDILMILDADMTVSPEDLPKFYKAIIGGKGDFINGSRLVYPLENQSMRFFNILGNKFFATAFSFVLRQRFKDTLCGTKVLSRSSYEKIEKNRNYFGDFDPFGDFDLLFGASRMGLKIAEIPIVYKARTYGETNISRWKHGWLLLKMLFFAARKIKFI